MPRPGRPLPEIGSKFGRLTVAEVGLYVPVPAGGLGVRAVRVDCSCGTTKVVRLPNLLKGTTTSCGCLNREQTREMWKDPAYRAAQQERGSTLLRERWNDPAFAERARTRASERNRQTWLDPERAASLRQGARVRMTVHGLSTHPLYGIHQAMLERCYNPKARGYARYGGRGIRVYGPWHDRLVAIPAMHALLGPRPMRTTLDRIDNDGHYVPGNLRWSTQPEQNANQGHGGVAPLTSSHCNVSRCRCGGQA